MGENEKIEIPMEFVVLKNLNRTHPKLYNVTVSLLADKGLEWCRDAHSEEWRNRTPYKDGRARFYKLNEDEQKASLAIAKNIADMTVGQILFDFMGEMQREVSKEDNADKEEELLQIASSIVEKSKNA